LSDEDSEDGEEEDEIGQEFTPAVDALLFRTIAAIRSRQSDVYDPQVHFFSGMHIHIFSLFAFLYFCLSFILLCLILF
jgi:hypothetical protein